MKKADTNKALWWRAEGVPAELRPMLSALAGEYPIWMDKPAGSELRFERGTAGEVTASRDGKAVTIRYGAPNLALRAVSAALSGLIPAKGAFHEQSPFTSFGIMLDCSRNAVMTPEHLKRWMRRLALLGYNQVMLYTEDTYEIPGEPYFGYHRGRYTQDELRDLDAFAASLGIEMVGCIQTLAHLEQIFRWRPYQALCDYGSTILVGEDTTYDLIGKMLDSVGRTIRTRRIHIGMDEAWHLGRGAYLDRHGARRKFDIFNEHLARVVAMCRERGLQPMIWSDMYFAMGSPSHGYYDTRCNIPKDVVDAIPKEVQLVYWDYYHPDKAFYLDWIGRHRAMGYEPLMASGVWTWSQLWYNRDLTERNAGACLEACRETGLKEVFFTMWGDDGAYCDYDSALAGLAWTAEKGFAGNVDRARLAARFRAVCDGDYAAVTRACDITGPIGTAGVLWDDPLLGIFATTARPPDADWTWPAMQKRYAGIRDDLRKRKGANSAGDLKHAELLADVLARKIAWRSAFEQAYARRDRRGLTAVRTEALKLAGRYRELMESWRRNWMGRNKPQGFEVIQIRLSSRAARFEEAALRIHELLAGKTDRIPELDERPPAMGAGGGWHGLASGSVNI